MNRIFIYGLGGAEDNFRCIRYSYVDAEDRVTDLVKMEAEIMRMDYPSINHIYQIDARGGLSNDYLRAVKKNTIESNIIFKDILERKGYEILLK